MSWSFHSECLFIIGQLKIEQSDKKNVINFIDGFDLIVEERKIEKNSKYIPKLGILLPARLKTSSLKFGSFFVGFGYVDKLSDFFITNCNLCIEMQEEN